MRKIFLMLVMITSMLISCESNEENLVVGDTKSLDEEPESVYEYGKLYVWTGHAPCPRGPGFCSWSIPKPKPIWWTYNPITTNDDFYEETDADAVFTSDLDVDNSVMRYRFVDIRESWFEEGGYLDGTFSIPDIALASELAAHFGVNAITLNEGIYDMISDEETGDYLVSISVTIN